MEQLSPERLARIRAGHHDCGIECETATILAELDRRDSVVREWTERRGASSAEEFFAGLPYSEQPTSRPDPWLPEFVMPDLSNYPASMRRKLEILQASTIGDIGRALCGPSTTEELAR